MLLLPYLIAPVAFAEGYSVDIELLRPGFSGAPPGIDAPEVQKRGAVTAGGVLQYQLNPLVLSEGGEEVGAVVANRFVLALGASVDVGRRFAVRGALPTSLSLGSEVPALAADGITAGDLSAGVRFEVVETDLFAVGLHADLAVPISTPLAYAGEAGLRFLPGVAFAVTPGDLRVGLDTSFTLRGEVPTQQALAMGQEMAAGLDISYALLDGRLVPHAFVVSRLGLQSELASLGSVPVELLAGAQAKVAPEWIIDAYGGRGLTAGYGATDARVVVGLTYRKIPADPAPIEKPLPVFSSSVTDDELEKLIEETPEPEPEPAAAPLAQVTQAEIVIRDMLQFELGTDKLVPSSIPTLRAVATLMNDNPDILSLVVEGHASGEGSFESNYALSVARSLAVLKALVNLDVHPSRLAVRGYGETVPLVEGDHESNRRVVFTITNRLHPAEPNPGWSTQVTLPWSGETRSIPAANLQPIAPATQPARTAPAGDLGIDKSRFDDDEDEE